MIPAEVLRMDFVLGTYTHPSPGSEHCRPSLDFSCAADCEILGKSDKMDG